MKPFAKKAVLSVIALAAVFTVSCQKNSEYSPITDMSATLPYGEVQYAADYDGAVYSESVPEVPYTTDSADYGVPFPDESAVTEKRIKTGSINLETTSFDDAVTFTEDLAVSLGGYVESSVLSAADDNERNVSYVLRVPEESFDKALDSLAGLGGVLSRSSSETDVTEQYTDIASRLSVKEAEERRLLELIDQAEELGDIILLEERLSGVRSDIEYYKARVQGIDRKASFSTVQVYIYEVADVYDAENLWDRAGKAFSGSIDGVAGFAQSAVVFVVGAFVPLLILAAAAAVAVLVFKKLSRSKKSGK